MSHFAVMIIGESPEEQLKPYDEDLRHTFKDTEDEDFKDYETKTSSAVVLANGQVFSKFDKRFEKNWQREVPFGTSSNDKFIPPVGAVVKEMLRKDIWPTFELYMKDYSGSERDPVTKRYGYNHNPRAKWDWYSLGGRWMGFLKLKPKTLGLLGEPGVFDNKAKPGHADAAKIKDIDFEGMIAEARAEAKNRYEKVEALLGGQIPKLTFHWSDLIDDNNEKYKSLTIHEKREMYNGQNAKQIVKDTSNVPGLSKDDRSLLVWLDLEDYQEGKERFIDLAGKGAIATFAVIKDGEWYERGNMGWWGMVAAEKDQDKWLEEFNKLIAGLPGDTLISIYDCHI